MTEGHDESNATGNCASHEGHHHPKIPLTPARQRILDVLCASARPLGAYDMIDRLADSTGKRPAPISIYRALEFLVDHGFVHRLSSRNAYLACWQGHDVREPVVFLLCEDCGSVREVVSRPVFDSLQAVAQDAGFGVRSQVIELTGRCASCQETAAP